MWQVSKQSQKQNRDKECDVRNVIARFMALDLLRDDGAYLVRFPYLVDLKYIWVVLFKQRMW